MKSLTQKRPRTLHCRRELLVFIMLSIIASTTGSNVGLIMGANAQGRSFPTPPPPTEVSYPTPSIIADINSDDINTRVEKAERTVVVMSTDVQMRWASGVCRTKGAVLLENQGANVKKGWNDRVETIVPEGSIFCDQVNLTIILQFDPFYEVGPGGDTITITVVPEIVSGLTSDDRIPWPGPLEFRIEPAFQYKSVVSDRAVKTAYYFGAIASIVGGALGHPALATLIPRANMLYSISLCDFTRNYDIDIAQYPLQIRIGDSAYQYFIGAASLNLFLILLFIVGHLAFLFYRSKVESRAKSWMSEMKKKSEESSGIFSSVTLLNKISALKKHDDHDGENEEQEEGSGRKLQDAAGGEGKVGNKLDGGGEGEEMQEKMEPASIEGADAKNADDATEKEQRDSSHPEGATPTSPPLSIPPVVENLIQEPNSNEQQTTVVNSGEPKVVDDATGPIPKGEAPSKETEKIPKDDHDDGLKSQHNEGEEPAPSQNEQEEQQLSSPPAAEVPNVEKDGDNDDEKTTDEPVPTTQSSFREEVRASSIPSRHLFLTFLLLQSSMHAGVVVVWHNDDIAAKVCIGLLTIPWLALLALLTYLLTSFFPMIFEKEKFVAWKMHPLDRKFLKGVGYWRTEPLEDDELHKQKAEYDDHLAAEARKKALKQRAARRAVRRKQRALEKRMIPSDDDDDEGDEKTTPATGGSNLASQHASRLASRRGSTEENKKDEEGYQPPPHQPIAVETNNEDGPGDNASFSSLGDTVTTLDINNDIDPEVELQKELRRERKRAEIERLQAFVQKLKDDGMQPPVDILKKLHRLMLPDDSDDDEDPVDAADAENREEQRVWVDPPTFARHFAPLYQHYTKSRHWFVLLEIMVSLSYGILEGVRSTNGCVPVASASLAIGCLYLAALLHFRPFIAPIDSLCFGFGAVVGVLAPTLQVVFHADDWPTHTWAEGFATVLIVLWMYFALVRTTGLLWTMYREYEAKRLELLKEKELLSDNEGSQDGVLMVPRRHDVRQWVPKTRRPKIESKRYLLKDAPKERMHQRHLMQAAERGLIGKSLLLDASVVDAYYQHVEKENEEVFIAHERYKLHARQSIQSELMSNTSLARSSAAGGENGSFFSKSFRRMNSSFAAIGSFASGNSNATATGAEDLQKAAAKKAQKKASKENPFFRKSAGLSTHNDPENATKKMRKKRKKRGRHNKNEQEIEEDLEAARRIEFDDPYQYPLRYRPDRGWFRDTGPPQLHEAGILEVLGGPAQLRDAEADDHVDDAASSIHDALKNPLLDDDGALRTTPPLPRSPSFSSSASTVTLFSFSSTESDDDEESFDSAGLYSSSETSSTSSLSSLVVRPPASPRGAQLQEYSPRKVQIAPSPPQHRSLHAPPTSSSLTPHSTNPLRREERVALEPMHQNSRRNADSACVAM